MSLSTIIMAITLQAGEFTCFQTGEVNTCRAPDGSTYIERRLGDQIVRQGTNPDGSSWNEYERKVFDGLRTEGLNSAGRTWASQCNPRTGTTGTGRDGKFIFIPPRSRRTDTTRPPDQSDTDGCP